MKLRRISAICAAAVLTAATIGASAQTSDDKTVLAIEAGRLVAMLGQASVLLKEPEAEAPTGGSATETLNFVVARYNVLRARACADRVIVGAHCAFAYAPVLRDDPAPFAVQQQEESDVEGRVLPFWELVCAKLDDPDHAVCQLE